MFVFLSSAVGAAFLLAALAGFEGRSFKHEALIRVPRARLAGEVLGIVCLAWSAHHATLMLEGNLVGLRKFVWMLVPVIAVLAYAHLEYLFSRALGGMLVLCVSAMLHGAFAQQISARPLYSLICYLVGLWGLVLIGLPWRFRDLLLLMSRSERWRRGISALWLLIGASFLVMPFIR